MADKRIQLNLNEKYTSLLNELKRETRVSSVSGVLRDALRTYYAIYEMLKATPGAKLMLFNPATGKQQELVFLSFYSSPIVKGEAWKFSSTAPTAASNDSTGTM